MGNGGHRTNESERGLHAECLDEMSRASHTLKGLASMFDFGHIKDLAHRTETVFDGIRKREIVVDDATLGLLFDSVDVLRDSVRRVTGEDQNVTAALGINLPAIETCANGAEGLSLAELDASESLAIGASASPTLFINGVQYSGARTPEGYKQAICASFNTAPAECNTTLSSTSAAASGGCE